MNTKYLWLAGLLLAGGVGAQEQTGEGQPGSGSVDEPVYAPDDFTEEVGNDSDPFAAVGYVSSQAAPVPMARLREKRQTLQVRVEVWEVDSRELVVAMDGFKGVSAVGNWRGEKLQDETSRLVHSPVVVLEEKSRGKAEAVAEEIYPTEYEPPEILPEKVVEQILEQKNPESLNELISSLTTGATSTAFETRNAGFTCDVAVQPVTAETGCWDVSLSLEDVMLSGMRRFSAEALHIEMPVFSRFNTGGLHRVAESRWQLLSAVPRPGGLKPTAEKLSWVTLIRVDPAR